MPFTVQSVTDEARLIYRDMPEATCLSFLQIAHADLLADCPLIRNHEDINYVANQVSYAPTAQDMQRITSVLHYAAADADRFTYKMVSHRAMEKDHGSHLLATATEAGELSNPKCYVRAESDGSWKIGIFPPQAAASVAGVPKLRVYYVPISTLAQGGNLPELVNDKSTYLFYALYRWALVHDRKSGIYKDFERDYQTAKAKLRNRVMQLMIDVEPEVRPYVRQLSRPI